MLTLMVPCPCLCSCCKLLSIILCCQDPRLDGGYEAVPTRDIHMRQVGLADLWDFFLEEYVQPLQQAVFIGYDDVRHLSIFIFGCSRIQSKLLVLLKERENRLVALYCKILHILG